MKKPAEEQMVEDEDGIPTRAQPKKNKKKRKGIMTSHGKRQIDPEYGVSRGVDFKAVQTIVNFDLPKDTKSYTHRVGRTARGTSKGSALSLVLAGNEKENFQKTMLDREASGCKVKPYQLNTKVIESFRYRVEDVMHRVTKGMIRNARLAEIKKEILNSEKLKKHFAENPDDLAMVKHTHPLSKKEQGFAHLRVLPSYLLPVPVNNDEQEQEQEEGTGEPQQKRAKKGPEINRHKGKKHKKKTKKLWD